MPGVQGSVQGSGIKDHILFKLHTAGFLTLRRDLKNFVGASPIMVDCSLKAMQIVQSLGWEDPLEKEMAPASGTFPMSQLFASDDQNTGVSGSASVLPASI